MTSRRRGWLVPTSLNAGLFSFSLPEQFFTYPVLQPGTQVELPFHLFTAQGLFAVTWDGSASYGARETGVFFLEAEWWTGDPAAGGALVGLADPTALPYEALLAPVMSA